MISSNRQKEGQQNKADITSDAVAEANSRIESEKDSTLDNEAMVAFSRAMADGVNVMSLPDAPPKKETVPELDDTLAATVY